MKESIRLTKSEKEELLKYGVVYIARGEVEIFIELCDYDRGYHVTVLDSFTIVNLKKDDIKMNSKKGSNYFQYYDTK